MKAEAITSAILQQIVGIDKRTTVIVRLQNNYPDEKLLIHNSKRRCCNGAKKVIKNGFIDVFLFSKPKY